MRCCRVLSVVFKTPEMHIPPWYWFSITTTLPQLGQFLAGNRFAEGKATKLSSAWTGRHEEVLKVHFLRTVIILLALLRMVAAP